jgi:hypothetical protein
MCFVLVWFISNLLLAHELPLSRLVFQQWLCNGSYQIYRESLTEQLDTTLADEQAIDSTEATSEWDVGSEDDNASDNTGDRGNASDNGGHVKIGAEAALADVSHDFGRSKVMRGRILYLKNSSCLFLKGFA